MHSLKAYGYLRKSDGTIKGIRLYCSQRNNHKGCGRTYPIYFEQHIPYASLTTRKVSNLIQDRVTAPIGDKVKNIDTLEKDVIVNLKYRGYYPYYKLGSGEFWEANHFYDYFVKLND